MLKSFMHPSSNTKTDSNRTNQPAYAPGKPVESSKPAETARPVAAAKEEAIPEAKVSAPIDNGSKLIVGPNIKLKGSEITDCEILVVEGRVEASMNSRDMIRGTFEGDLTARKRLVIYATGKVTGVIRYGAMMIEEGGYISGDVERIAAGPTLAKVPDVPAQTKTSEPVEQKASEQDPGHSGSTFSRNLAGRRQG